MFRTIVILTWAAATALTVPGTCIAAEEETEKPPKLIQAADAAAHAGETCTVVMKVESSRLLKDRDIVFLNSKRDYRDEDNFTVVMFEETLKKYAELEIDDPSKHYYKRTLHVTGGVELRRGKPQIILKKPEQIKIISPKKRDSNDESEDKDDT